MEIWKQVAGHGGMYEVSNLGQIRRIETGRVLKTKLAGPGKYKAVNLGFDGIKTRYIHRLVLETFVGQAPEGMQACHNDGNNQNNCLENLRWDSKRNNELDKIEHGTHNRAKLNRKTASEVREMYASGEYSQSQLAKMYGVNQTAIGFIVRLISYA